MKISEILVESQQIDEGPLLNKIGAGIGKVAGTVAKGIGAVAGGVVGAGKALAKGYQAGKTTVGGAGDDVETDPAADTAATTTPTAKTKPAAGGAAPVGGPTAQPGAGAVNKSGPAGTAPAKTLAGQAKVAADKTAAATASQDPAAAGQTMYAQVKANIDKLDKKGKQRILQLLQKSVTAPEQKPAAGAAPTKPAAGKPGASPAAGGTGFGYDGNTGLPFNSQAERDAGLAKQKADKAAATSASAADPGAGAMGAMAGQLAKGGAAEPNTMANAPVSKTNTAKPGNPNQATIDADRARIMGQPDKVTADPAAAPADSAAAPKARGGRKAGAGPSMTPDAIRKRASREANAAKQQATEPKKKPAAPSQAEMDADRERMMGVTSDSVIRTRPMMAEGFSLFRKR